MSTAHEATRFGVIDLSFFKLDNGEQRWRHGLKGKSDEGGGDGEQK